ncbi:hypothetical protein FPV67DRAFT_1467879 [Lyophyllum atratum]|nr:hypothetical protein FPV67DRAFT_1467879 [Lyophyllum atratum]
MMPNDTPHLVPDIHDKDTHLCAKCNGQLRMRLAQGGDFPGHWFIRCHHCRYHYTFPFHAPTCCDVAVPTASRDSTSARGSVAKPARLPRLPCTDALCPGKHHRQCPHQWCKRCCVQHGGCVVHTSAHVITSTTAPPISIPRLMPRPAAHSPTILNPRLLDLPPLDPSFDAFLEGLSADSPERHLDRALRNQQRQAAEQEREFDLLLNKDLHDAIEMSLEALRTDLDATWNEAGLSSPSPPPVKEHRKRRATAVEDEGRRSRKRRAMAVEDKGEGSKRRGKQRAMTPVDESEGDVEIVGSFRTQGSSPSIPIVLIDTPPRSSTSTWVPSVRRDRVRTTSGGPGTAAHSDW